MRSEFTIKQEISKLQAELADVQNYEHMVTSGLHILNNLGWTHTAKDGWKKPKDLPKARSYNPEFDHPIKAGDYIRHSSAGNHFYVTAINGARITARQLIKAVNKGFICDHQFTTLRADYCTVVAPHTIKL